MIIEMKYKPELIGLTILFIIMVYACSNPTQDKGIDQVDLPNIVLVMGDDHGWDEVGYNGHPFVKTPVLDEMAASGLRFDRFYAGHPSCSPTRGSFITGRHPNRYGTFTPGYSIRPEEISIAQVLRAAGYVSAHFGKWHLGPVKKESPTNPRAMGFDEYVSHDNFFELNPALSRNGAPPRKIEGEGSEIIIDETIRFIQRSDKLHNPFLAVVWFGSPHEPYSGLPQDLSLYENLPDSMIQTEVGLTSNETGERVKRPLRDVLQERYAEITAMDRAIGKLRSYLKENGLKENTVVWYCGDNGTPPSAARTGMTLKGQKGNLYEGGIRVPGVLEWPVIIRKPASTSAISVTSDILPTLAEITGQPLSNRPLDGISLVPIFNDPSKLRTKPLFFWSFNVTRDFANLAQPYIDPALQDGTTPLVKKLGGKFTRTFCNFKYERISETDFWGNRVMMGNQYKLIVGRQSPNEEKLELYDMLNDDGETKNLADQLPEITAEMQNQLRKWQESVLNSLTGADYN